MGTILFGTTYRESLAVTDNLHEFLEMSDITAVSRTSWTAFDLCGELASRILEGEGDLLSVGGHTPLLSRELLDLSRADRTSGLQ